MKKTLFLKITLFFAISLLMSCSSSGKSGTEEPTSLTSVYGKPVENFELIFFRQAEGMMSGGSGMGLQISINDQVIGNLAGGTVLNYTIFSEGELKIKIVAIAAGTTIGSPKVINLQAKSGEVFALLGSASYPKGANARILNAKEYEKFTKKKWADTMKKQEDIENPLVVTD